MTAAPQKAQDVTLPEGISLRRVAQVLLDAAPLYSLATRDMTPGDKAELQKIISECSERGKLLRQRTGQ